MPEPILFTQEKYSQLQADFRRLTAERKSVMQRLKDAREMGDLSENGAYKYAKLELGSLNRQLRHIQHLLENGQVFIKGADSTTVEFGSTVILTANGKEVTYTLVSQYESNPSEGKISVESPLGQALLNKKENDEALLTLPAGTTTYLIKKIS